MSYTLAFWKDANELDPQDVYERLNAGESLAAVPAVNSTRVTEALRTRLAGWKLEGNFLSPPEASEDNGPAFDVYIGEQMVEFTGYGVTGDHMNAIIDVMRPLDFRLYDPQTGDRYN